VSGSTSPNDPAVTARLAELEATVVAQQAALEAEHAALEAERERRAAAEAERDRLRDAYEALKIQVELAHRRLVIAKAERVDTTQLELEFAAKLAELDQLAGLVEPETDATGGEGGAAGDKPKRRRGRRCELHKVIGEERIEIPNPIYEGKFERIGAEEETTKLKWRRGGLVRVVIARLKYRTTPSAATANEHLSAVDVSAVINATEVAVASEPMTAPEDATSSTIEVPEVDATSSAQPSPIEVPPTQLVTSPVASSATSPEVVAPVRHSAAATANENLSAADVSAVISATEVAVASEPMTAPEDATSSTIEVPEVDATSSAQPSPIEVPPTQLVTSPAASVAALPEVVAPVPTSPSSADQAVGDSITDSPTIVTAAMPPQLLPGSYALPSLLAHIASDKLCDGLPLHRQEDRFARLGATIYRSTMARWLEEIGAIVGATIVEAMRKEALATAFCIATDATGVLVQPDPRPDKKRQPCRRAHFFVQIADADHVFFEYTPVETSKVVSELFRGFSGFVQADAKSVYDVLYRLPNQRDRIDDDPPDLAVRYEVGCWSHARTKLWEAAVTTQDPVAREGLARIMRMFQLDRRWKALSPDERKALRERHLRPHVVAFFAFAEEAYERMKHQRGLLRSALGYCVRQKDALMRFLDDGRLEMTNNHSERQLRRVAVGRKAWLFVGSDDHGQAAGNLLTLIASARLHKLDPELYLRDVFRVLPHWPRERYLELAPRYWSATRARLDPKELDQELGPLTVPEPALPTAIPSPIPAELRPAP
jgi:transposase IS66 family protein/transposase IS66-like protein